MRSDDGNATGQRHQITSSSFSRTSSFSYSNGHAPNDRNGNRVPAQPQARFNQYHRSNLGTNVPTMAPRMTATMEQVFFNLHCKIAQFCIRRTTPAFRSFVEHTFLLLAATSPSVLLSKVSSFVTVFVAHRTFVYRPKQQMRAAEAAATVRNISSTHNRIQGSSDSIAWTCLRSIPGFDPDAHVTTIVLRYEESEGLNQTTSYVVPYEEVERDVLANNNNAINQAAHDTTIYSSTQMESSFSNETGFCDTASASSEFHPSDRISYSYSQTKGYLLLPQAIRDRHNIQTQYVVIPLSDSKCFGETYLQAIVANAIGTDTIVLNWFLALHNGDGYMYRERPRTLIYQKQEAFESLDQTLAPVLPVTEMDHITRAEDKVIDLRFASDYLLMHSLSKASTPTSFFRKLDRFIVFKLGVLLINIFLFCVTTTLVSFTLRETQERMVDFTFLLQSHIRQRLPYVQLVFKHVVESLVFVPITVGTIFFLIEIFEDQFLAIMVLTLVWICEVFSAIGSRTLESVRYFPRTFFLYFSLFNIYFFSCPFGFSYTSFVSTALFLLHSILFFWNRFELPALQAGVVSQATPRLGGVMYFLSNANEPHHRHFHDMRPAQNTANGTSNSTTTTAATPMPFQVRSTGPTLSNASGADSQHTTIASNISLNPSNSFNRATRGNTVSPPSHPNIMFPGFPSSSIQGTGNHNNNSGNNNTTNHNSFIPMSIFGEGNHGSVSPAMSSVHSRTSPLAGPFYTRFSTSSRSLSQTSLERELRGGNILYFGGGGDDDDSALAAYGPAQESLTPTASNRFDPNRLDSFAESPSNNTSSPEDNRTTADR